MESFLIACELSVFFFICEVRSLADAELLLSDVNLDLLDDVITETYK